MTAADAGSAAFASGELGIRECDGIMVPRMFDPFAGLAAALAAIFGEQTAAAYRNGPWGLGARQAEVAALAEQAGFSHVSTIRHQQPTIFDGDPRQLMRTLATTAVAPQVAALDPAGQRALLAAIEDAVAPLIHDDAICSHTVAHLMIATAG